MAALKGSLAKEVSAKGGRATKEKRTKTIPDRRQPSLLLSVSGGRRRKGTARRRADHDCYEATEEGTSAPTTESRIAPRPYRSGKYHWPPGLPIASMSDTVTSSLSY